MKKNWQERFDEMSEMNEFYGLPYNDLVDSSIKQFISDIIAQTREETIKDMKTNIVYLENCQHCFCRNIKEEVKYIPEYCSEYQTKTIIVKECCKCGHRERTN